MSAQTPSNPTWHHTMLRVKDPKQTVPFYEKHFGMHLIGKYNNESMGFTSYFMEKFKNNANIPTMNSPEAEKYLSNNSTTLMEFVHYHGTESDPDYKVNNGNVQPHRGYGHIAFNVDDVMKSSEILDAAGVKFQKKPWEGTMKTIAFVLDPDNYWIELVGRNTPSEFEEDCNLSQTMIRVKDAKKSIEFYTQKMGMKLVQKRQFETFSLYFLISPTPGTQYPDPESPESASFTKNLWNSTLELTHNHGTEEDESFSYHNGNTQPEGFGYLSFLVDDVNEFSKTFTDDQKIIMPKMVNSKNVAYFSDPDNYCVQVVQKNCFPYAQ